MRAYDVFYCSYVPEASQWSIVKEVMAVTPEEAVIHVLQDKKLHLDEISIRAYQVFGSKIAAYKKVQRWEKV